MCATFEIEKQMFVEKMERLHIHMKKFNLEKRILPHMPAPAIVKKDDEVQLESMNFSLIPHWSKEKKPKFATHNARLETIKEKPTWKHLFGQKHCLVPITTFIEPIYEGEYAGNMVKFILNECFLVPALFDSWTDKETGEVIDSFSIITSKPTPFVKKIGHDRSPMFIDQSHILTWLDTENEDEKFFNKLLKEKDEPKFSIKIDRKMKPGWEKRI